jgi:hypothetical protein
MPSADELFPVFSGLHVVSTPPAGKRKSKEPKPEPLTVTGNVSADLETALRATAFLIEFIERLDPEDLQRCADAVREFRQERGL